MNKLFQISRRSFVKRCAVTAAATGLPLWFVERELSAAQDATPAPASPNDRPAIGLIGCGGRMGDDARAAGGGGGRRGGNAQANNGFGDVVAVCDVDDNHASGMARTFTRNGKTPAKFSDFRKVIEMANVNVIVQATPDHWHTFVNVAAAKAKKDVYGEKPLTLTVDEGKHVIKAVRDNKIVFQTGTQQRSDRRFPPRVRTRPQRAHRQTSRSERLGAGGLRDGPFQTGQVPPPT